MATGLTRSRSGGCLCGAVRYRVDGPLREILVDVAQIGDHAWRHLIEDANLRQFEDEGGGDMRLLVLGLRAVEQPRLAVMVGEQFGADAQLLALLKQRYPGASFVIINAGVPGRSWLQGFRFLEARGHALKPDLVIKGGMIASAAMLCAYTPGPRCAVTSSSA